MTMNVVGMFELLLDTSICKVYVVKFVIFLTEFLKFFSFAQGRYGTRSTSALLAKATGELFFYEKHLENDLWKEQTATFQIEETK